ncbi:hypothetical protein LPJ64_001119 [Coemansia asiatica]|uniref:ABC1 atypical kinase-like domain-containing protein n=1 Tax=Coemansia asiatica TaxID=1052880 RepID=A0A9W7XQK2_9FUNG|nr:hypothetical protein LPJ64_001119 [Coemansia asiatica]
MALADAYIVLRAAKKIARLAISESATDIKHRIETLSLFNSRVPQANEQSAESNRANVYEESSSDRHYYRGPSEVGFSITLHPGPLDRTHLLRAISKFQPAYFQREKEEEEAVSAVKSKESNTREFTIITADLSYLRLHVPPPPIVLRGEQLDSRAVSTARHKQPDEIKEQLAHSDDVEQRLELQAASMPSTRASRLFHYGSLAVGLGLGALGEATKRWSGIGNASLSENNNNSSSSSSVFLSKANIDRIVEKLSRMRGAALKLGQMLSIQDSKSISPEISQILQRVQNAANYVPISQVEKVMRKEFGQQWREMFDGFEDIPFAAASIGQVHKSHLNPNIEERQGFGKVAVKVQYPGVASSIDSDLNNMQSLLMMSKLLPRGMYLENTIRVARKELHWECDYQREAEAMVRFGHLLANDPVFVVPRLVPELSSGMVLTSEFMDGMHMKKAESYSQEVRDHIGTSIMRLCLQELFEFEFMQTDPNWANFLYNKDTNRIALLDFGASRSFDKSFLDKYLLTLKAAMEGDRESCRHWSTELGFLTGYEADVMTQAHVNSVLELGKPFAASAIYDFGNQTVSDNVRSAIPVMLRHRLTPPPDETYSLHRKLSGAFLLCIRLRARVPCQDMFKSITSKYTFSDGCRLEYKN